VLISSLSHRLTRDTHGANSRRGVRLRRLGRRQAQHTGHTDACGQATPAASSAQRRQVSHQSPAFPLALLLLLFSAAGCSTTDGAPKPSSVGLAIIVESDLALPDDLDHAILTVTQAGAVIRTEEFDLGAAGKLLPAEFRLTPGPDPSPVTVRVAASKLMQVRVERNAVVAIPTRTLGLLRMPLNYLCLGLVDASGNTTCAAGETCKQGTCEDATLRELPGYEVGPWTEMPADAAAAGIDCFNVLNCFSVAERATVD